MSSAVLAPVTDCAWFRELASGELDGELTLEEEQALGQHLAGCPTCGDARRRVWRTVRLVRALLRWTTIAP